MFVTYEEIGDARRRCLTFDLCRLNDISRNSVSKSTKALRGGEGFMRTCVGNVGRRVRDDHFMYSCGAVFNDVSIGKRRRLLFGDTVMTFSAELKKGPGLGG